jgi:hypothetical protein
MTENTELEETKRCVECFRAMYGYSRHCSRCLSSSHEWRVKMRTLNYIANSLDRIASSLEELSLSLTPNNISNKREEKHETTSQ